MVRLSDLAATFEPNCRPGSATAKHISATNQLKSDVGRRSSYNRARRAIAIACSQVAIKQQFSSPTGVVPVGCGE